MITKSTKYTWEMALGKHETVYVTRVRNERDAVLVIETMYGAQRVHLSDGQAGELIESLRAAFSVIL